MLRAMIFNPDGSRVAGGAELVDAWPSVTEGWIWLDLEAAPPVAEATILKHRFGIDALAIADAQRERHPPKLELFRDHAFLLLKTLDAASRTIEFSTIQLSLFFGPRFLITRRDHWSPDVETLWQEIAEGQAQEPWTPVMVLYRVCRNAADRVLPILLDLENRLAEIEDEIFENRSDRLVEELIGYNTNLKKLRRILAYTESATHRLSQQSSVIRQDAHHEFIDLHDQVERQASLAGLYQEIISDLVDGYISLNGHHLNQVMKVLTSVTVIFVPLSLLVGMYGMNFEHIPELSYEHGYQVLLGAMGLIAVSLLMIFRRKKWL